MKSQFFDHRGRHVVIDNEIGRGGEGAVYELAGSPRHVAKIYHNPVDLEKENKLALMLELGDDSLQKIAAWPLATLHDRVGGPTRGLILPRIDNPTEIHELYSPARRKFNFPTSDWRFLVRTARNCAAVFDSFHSKNIVIGDVNQGNILVSKNATVNLIDCDSFQICGNETTYKCQVGVAHFTPPELDSYELLRTSNHDNFGLAVMIFHLLFMGRHPFSGRFSGAGDMPLEKAIKENRFAYGSRAARYEMSPPPNSLTLDDVPAELAKLFEMAFAAPGRGLQRPTAEQWGTVLQKLETEITKCSRDAGHFHLGGHTCPWCRIISQGGPNFFISVSIKATEARSVKFDLKKVWFEISLVKAPENAEFKLAPPRTGSLTPRPVPEEVRSMKGLHNTIALIGLGAAVLSLLGILIPRLALFSIPILLVFSVWWTILWMQSPRRKLIRSQKRKLADCKGKLKLVVRDISQVGHEQRKIFQEKLEQLRQAKAQYENLNSACEREYHQLQSHARDRQLDEYLEHCFLSQAKIPGIGPSLLMTLESYGIETAGDITYDRVMAVPGIGPVKTSELLGWRAFTESQFRFDVKKGAPDSIVQALNLKYLQKRIQLQMFLEAGPNDLRQICRETEEEMNQLRSQLGKFELAVAQAQIDLDSLIDA